MGVHPLASFDIFAFYESRAGTTSLTNVAGLTDSVHAVNGDNITVPTNWYQLIAAYIASTNATDTIDLAQLSAPSMRGKTLYDVNTMAEIAAGSAYATGNPVALDVAVDKAVFLTPGEFLNCLAQHDGTTAADLITCGVFLGNPALINNYPYAGMPIETVRFTTATAAVANAWTVQSLTAQQTLQAGRYAIVGMKAQTPTGQLARLIMNETAGRPGCVPVAALTNPGHPIFKPGNLGVWGEFTHDAPPQVEIKAAAADAAAACIYYLDIVKIA